MKTQIFLMQNAPVIIIGFLLLVTTTLLGCNVFFNANHVMPRDSVLLTLDDLYKIGLTKHNHISRNLDYPYTIRGTSEHHIKERSVIAGFEQGDSRELTIQYWLFDSSHTAKKKKRRKPIGHGSLPPLIWVSELSEDAPENCEYLIPRMSLKEDGCHMAMIYSRIHSRGSGKMGKGAH